MQHRAYEDMLHGPAVAFWVDAGVGFGVDPGVGFGVEVMPDCLIKLISASALLFLLVLVHGVL